MINQIIELAFVTLVILVSLNALALAIYWVAKWCVKLAMKAYEAFIMMRVKLPEDQR